MFKRKMSRRRLSRRRKSVHGHHLSRGLTCKVPKVKRITGNQLAERCWHLLYTIHRAFYIGSEINELGLSLMRMYSEGAMDYLKWERTNWTLINHSLSVFVVLVSAISLVRACGLHCTVPFCLWPPFISQPQGSWILRGSHHHMLPQLRTAFFNLRNKSLPCPRDGGLCCIQGGITS